MIFLTFLLLTLQFEAGRSHENILGGTDVDVKSFPFVATLITFDGVCTSTIVDSTTVITAAHCLRDSYVGDLAIRVGSNHIEIGGQVHRIRKAIIHPLYKLQHHDYDVGVMKLHHPLQFSTSVNKAKFKTIPSLPNEGTWVTTLGWSPFTLETIDDQRPEPVNLQAVTLPTISRTKCQRSYGPLSVYPLVITKRMICAISAEVGYGPCHGDSGGPLIDTATNALLGLTSWGIGCGSGKFADVYTWLGDPEIWDFIQSHRD